MAEKRRNHTVPKVYLKQFAIPQKPGKADSSYYLFQYNKANQVICRTEISNASVENYFYTLEGVEISNIWEDYYCDNVESDMANTLPRFIENSSRKELIGHERVVNENIKTVLAKVMINQLYRGRATREHLLMITPDGEEEVIQKVKNQFGKTEDEEWNQYVNNYQVSPEVIKIAMALACTDQNRLNEHAELLINRFWVMYRIDGDGEFITSDNPVMFVDSSSLDSMPFHNGLFNPATVVYYPISPKLMIALYHYKNRLGIKKRDDGRLFLLNIDDSFFIHSLNHLQIQQCTRQAFAKTKQILQLATLDFRSLIDE